MNHGFIGEGIYEEYQNHRYGATTKVWYCGYHALVAWLPRLGSLSRKAEIEHFLVMIEFEVVVIAMLVEEVDDPLLLFGHEQFAAVMIAIVSTVSAQILLDGIAQGRIILMQHILENGGETPCAKNNFSLLIPAALPIVEGSGVDGRS